MLDATHTIPNKLPWLERLRRFVRWWRWNHRHFTMFVLIGFTSIVLEVLLIRSVFPANWNDSVKSLLGFVASMMFALVMNARFNFRVSRKEFIRVFVLFVLVSVVSYTLNLIAAEYLQSLGWTHAHWTRFVTSGLLFSIGYILHRKYTFRNVVRNLGLAVYLVEQEDLQKAYARVGDHMDHIHLDLVDQTFDASAASVSLAKIREARRIWKWQPFALHIMSKTPLSWIEQCYSDVEWFAVHIDVDDDLMEVISRCREYNRLVGLVWHHHIQLSSLFPYLPHVDFILVLGIDKPGTSGQRVMQAAIEAAELFTRMTTRYNLEVMFDGGVTVDNVREISASYVVSSSTVLRADSPINTALVLRGGGTLE